MAKHGKEVMYVEVTALYETETEKALGVKMDFESEVIWLPFSQIKILRGKRLKDQPIDVEMPEWLAIDKGFE